MFDLEKKENYLSVSEADFINWNKLRGSTIFVTGATGLIGTSLIKALNFANNRKNLGIKVLGLV